MGVDKSDNFWGLAEIVGECVRKLLESGFKLPLHCAEVGKNGSLLFVRISQSGEGPEASLKTEFLTNRGASGGPPKPSQLP
jgi:hypothetical protein